MKKISISFLAVAVLVFSAALAQTDRSTAAPLAAQFTNLEASLKAVQKLIDDKDNKISDTQAAQLLPYLREVRANSALTSEASEFYAMAIRRLLSDKQLETAGLKPKAEAAIAAGGSADQGLAGGGAGGGSSEQTSASISAITVASNPFLEGERVTSLDSSILLLMNRAERVQ